MSASTAVADSKNESEEDDYMSDRLLAAAEDVKPGITRLSSTARLMKLEREAEEHREEQKRLARAKRNVEAEKREEAMATPIGQETKGFELLAKMGFKPGMNIGKQRDDALKEPIAIEMRSRRTGLGLEADQKRKASDRLAQELEITQKRTKFQNVLLGQYRERKRDHADDRQLWSDLRKSQAVCRDLELRADAQATPSCSGYWPPQLPQKPLHDEHDLTSSIAECHGAPVELESKREHFDRVLGRVTPDPVEEDEEDEIDPAELLPRLTDHLRQQHHYCVWCAVKYDDADDLAENCPGDTRLAHDDL